MMTTIGIMIFMMMMTMTLFHLMTPPPGYV